MFARGIHACCAWATRLGQHRSVRLYRASGDERSVWKTGRSANRDDAGRKDRRRCDGVARRRRLATQLRMMGDVQALISPLASAFGDPKSSPLTFSFERTPERTISCYPLYLFGRA